QTALRLRPQRSRFLKRLLERALILMPDEKNACALTRKRQRYALPDSSAGASNQRDPAGKPHPEESSSFSAMPEFQSMSHWHAFVLRPVEPLDLRGA
ncbi:MAG: hypothetical protein WAN81_07135, partial [Candidatus Binataceae bacterium]